MKRLVIEDVQNIIAITYLNRSIVAHNHNTLTVLGNITKLPALVGIRRIAPRTYSFTISVDPWVIAFLEVSAVVALINKCCAAVFVWLRGK